MQYCWDVPGYKARDQGSHMMLLALSVPPNSLDLVVCKESKVLQECTGIFGQIESCIHKFQATGGLPHYQ